MFSSTSSSVSCVFPYSTHFLFSPFCLGFSLLRVLSTCSISFHLGTQTPGMPSNGMIARMEENSNINEKK